MAGSVFISYATPDLGIARRAKALLIQSGIDSWIATRDSKGEWRETISGAIGNSKVVLLLWSQHSLASPEVKHEIELAEKHRRPIVPLRLDASELQGSLAYVLSGTHYIDASRGPLDRHSRALIETVREKLSTLPETPVGDEDDHPDQTGADDEPESEYAITQLYRIDAASSDLLHLLEDCPSITEARRPVLKGPPEEDGDLCSELLKRKLRPCLSCLKLLRKYHEGPGNLVSTVTWPNRTTLRIETDRLVYEQPGFRGVKSTDIPWYDVGGVHGAPKDWRHFNHRIEIVTKSGEAIQLNFSDDKLWHTVGAVLAGLAGIRW